MNGTDGLLQRKILGIIAVAASDLDAVTVDVEAGIAYIEGVVASSAERAVIIDTAAKLEGIEKVVDCLACERVLEQSAASAAANIAMPVLMHYHSLS
jgi:hypothetical protein